MVAIGLILTIVLLLLVWVGGVVFYIWQKRRFFKKQRVEVPEGVETPEELLSDLKPWQIGAKKPASWLHSGVSFIQVVLVSQIVPCRQFWAEWDGTRLIRTDNRAYKIPKEITYMFNGIFMWDIDNHKSINEQLIKPTQADADISMYIHHVADVFTAIGAAMAIKLSWKDMLIIILVIVAILVAGASAYFSYQTGAEITKQATLLNNTIGNYIVNHP